MKILIVLLCLLFISTASYAITVPPVVKKSFNSKFPDAKSVKWGKENSDEYEASFKLDGKKYTASFNSAGDWMETESPTTFDQLPTSVQNAFNDSYKGEKARLVTRIDDSKGQTKYEIEIKRKKKTIELFFEADGKQIK